jgi:hypothetical protein
VGASMPEQDKRNLWLYVGLFVSGLLNLTGLASIVDGLVTWAHFFRDIIDVYRTVIREPLAYVGNHLWPFGLIPHWFFDVFVLWSALFLAANIYFYRSEGETIFGMIRQDYRDDGFLSAFNTVFIFTLFFPVLLISAILGAANPSEELQRACKDILLNFLLILITFIVILFFNWQLKKYT